MSTVPTSAKEPQALDLTALGEALSDSGSAAAPAPGLSKGSDGAAEPYSFGDDADEAVPTTKGAEGKSAGTGNSGAAEELNPAQLQQQAPAPPRKAHSNPQVENIKIMFPDLDVDTIEAILASHGGDADTAVTTLLQMSDPTFVGPATTPLSQTESDAALARSLAAEQDRLVSQGGGPFMGAPPAAQQPNYDPTRLTYQPRVRKAPTSPAAQQAAFFQQQQQQQGQQGGQQQDSLGAFLPKWPGPEEAKAWQEDINKFAENGMAKAASTFSALRARATAMAAPQTQGSSSPQRQNSSASGSASGSGGGGSFLSSLGLGGPSTRQNAGYDRDPSPVGEDELARILARGARPSSGDSDLSSPAPPPKVDRNSAAAFAGSRGRAIQDRYGALAGGGARRGSAQAARDRALGNNNNNNNNNAQQRYGGEEEGDDDDLGWGAAARTGESGAPPPRPAKDATLTPKGPPATLDSVSRMDGAAGRGISRGGSTPASPNMPGDPSGAKTGAAATAAGAGAAAAGGLGAASTAATAESDDEDDLEYVSNPFEEED